MCSESQEKDKINTNEGGRGRLTPGTGCPLSLSTVCWNSGERWTCQAAGISCTRMKTLEWHAFHYGWRKGGRPNSFKSRRTNERVNGCVDEWVER